MSTHTHIHKYTHIHAYTCIHAYIQRERGGGETDRQTVRGKGEKVSERASIICCAHFTCSGHFEFLLTPLLSVSNMSTAGRKQGQSWLEERVVPILGTKGFNRTVRAVATRTSRMI